jgi:hypothetical protein
MTIEPRGPPIPRDPSGANIKIMSTLLLILLILLLIGVLPAWPYSSGWGYYPSAGLGLIVVILIVLLLMGRLESLSLSRRHGLSRERRGHVAGGTDAERAERPDVLTSRS